jgi:hypothetical protein
MGLELPTMRSEIITGWLDWRSAKGFSASKHNFSQLAVECVHRVKVFPSSSAPASFFALFVPALMRVEQKLRSAVEFHTQLLSNFPINTPKHSEIRSGWSMKT